MMEFVRAWYLGSGDWPLRIAVTICILFCVSVSHRLWKEYKNSKKKTLFPRRLWYYSAIYVRQKKGESYMPKYLALYSILILVAGTMEKVIEGNMGLFARLEIFGIVGGILGYYIFGIISAFLGAFWGSILAIRKNYALALSMMGWSATFEYLGGYLGVIISMAIFYYYLALWHELSLWVVVAAAIIPAMVVSVEALWYLIQHERQIIKFEEKIWDRYGYISNPWDGYDSVHNDIYFPPLARYVKKNEVKNLITDINENDF